MLAPGYSLEPGAQFLSCRAFTSPRTGIMIVFLALCGILPHVFRLTRDSSNTNCSFLLRRRPPTSSFRAPPIAYLLSCFILVCSDSFPSLLSSSPSCSALAIAQGCLLACTQNWPLRSFKYLCLPFASLLSLPATARRLMSLTCCDGVITTADPDHPATRMEKLVHARPHHD